MRNKPDKFDFSGWATKSGVRCKDGRTIMKGAFQHCDGKTVPMMWQHMHNDPSNIIGHAYLEARDEGIYMYGLFNETPRGKDSKEAVRHGDVTDISIFANDLRQQGTLVVHGAIREVSLVLTGANSEAVIENVSIIHGVGTESEYAVQNDEEAIMYMGLGIDRDSELSHSDDEETLEHASPTEVFDTLNKEQKELFFAVSAALMAPETEEEQPTTTEDQPVTHADPDPNTLEHSDTQGDEIVKHNLFAPQVPAAGTFDGRKDPAVLKHSAHFTPDVLASIMKNAQKGNGSFKDAFMAEWEGYVGTLAHADPDYGIENIDLLFPDARTLSNYPDFIKRDTEWVTDVLQGAHHTPFARIKSIIADITEDEARAKGYITGSLKKDEIFPLMQRITYPTTVYKKQKLDKDNVTDITDLDVLAWIKAEMRLMLNEELGRAILVGDGRDIASPDKINADCIRPIYTDVDLFTVKPAPIPAGTAQQPLDAELIIETIIRNRRFWKGTGKPTLFTTAEVLTEMLLIKDAVGRRIYNTVADLVAVMRVAKIVEVEVMEGMSRQVTTPTAQTLNLLAILVNMTDYNIGTDRGGQISFFDDFDLDYNQLKFLLETRMSGALIKPHAAMLVEQIATAG